MIGRLVEGVFGESVQSIAIVQRILRDSVWDDPRPPRIDPEHREIEVFAGDRLLTRSTRSLRVLETSGPPTFYPPPNDVDMSRLIENGSRSSCEWKGIAIACDLFKDSGRSAIAWTDPVTFPEFVRIERWIAFISGQGREPCQRPAR